MAETRLPRVLSFLFIVRQHFPTDLYKYEYPFPPADMPSTTRKTTWKSGL